MNSELKQSTLGTWIMEGIYMVLLTN